MTRRPRAIALQVPDRIVPMLSIAAGFLVVTYIVLMITTIFFAAWQTQLARGIDDTRARIHGLETEYYTAIARLDSTDPSSVGLVAPAKVEYVVAQRMPGLTFAGR
jgi:hypothetical protein